MAIWSSSTHYAIGNTATYNGLLYTARVPNTNVIPGSDLTTWILFASPPVPVVEVAMVGDGVLLSSSVPGSPIQFEGTFAPTLVSAAANLFLAGPASGAAASPTYRALVAADLPSITTLCFLAQMTGNQSVSDNVFTKAIFDTLVTNTMGTQYSTTTGLFTPTKAGKYLVWASGQGDTATISEQINVAIDKNGGFGVGTQVAGGVAASENPAGTASTTAFAMTVVAMNGSTDTLEVDIRVIGTGGSDTISGGHGNTFFGAVYLGP